MLVLTSGGSVLVRQMDDDQIEFFKVAKHCRKLLQSGSHSFGFFKKNGEEF